MQEIFSWKFPFWNFQSIELQVKTTTKKIYKIVFHILALQSWSTIRWSMVIHQNITSFRLLQHTLFQIGFKTFLFLHADLYFSFENKSTRHPICVVSWKQFCDAKWCFICVHFRNRSRWNHRQSSFKETEASSETKGPKGQCSHVGRVSSCHESHQGCSRGSRGKASGKFYNFYLAKNRYN